MIRRTAPRLAAALVAVLALGGCQLVGGGDSSDTPETAPATSAAASELVVDSEFTSDGSFQSHLSATGLKGVDFVYTVYPTRATPRTSEWYPKGAKYFTFTFQAYDLSRGLRDAFATKRKVYLDTVKVTSDTITADGGKTQHPYKLDVKAAKATFDPEPLTTDMGMLVTSPKGAFELRNQKIRTVSKDTRGINLTFTAVVRVQTGAGGDTYARRVVKQVVPIAIFASDKTTPTSKIPLNAG